MFATLLWIGLILSLGITALPAPDAASGSIFASLPAAAGLFALIWAGLAACEGWLVHRRRWQCLRTSPAQLPDIPTGSRSFAVSGAVAGLLLAVGVAAVIVNHAGGDRGVTRGGLLLAALAAFGASIAALVQTGRCWQAVTALVGLTLMSLAGCAAGAAVLSGAPDAAGHRIATTAALALLLAVLAWFWDWLGQVWHQQLDDGRAWTTAGRIRLLLPSYSMLLAGLAVGLNAAVTSLVMSAASPVGGSARIVILGAAAHGVAFLAAWTRRRSWRQMAWVYLLVTTISLLLFASRTVLADFAPPAR